MRINKLFSNYGYFSRKETNRMIEESRIRVNGNLCMPGQWVEKEDDIRLDEKPVHPKTKIYLALNKPPRVTCTSLKTVTDNIVDYIGFGEYLFPVGRLDKASQGLILLTNDGDLANRILEAQNDHEKEYEVTLDKPFDDSFLENMAGGVEISDTLTRNCKMMRTGENSFRIVLTQGLNRQIRRMSRVFGYGVLKLERVRILCLSLGTLDLGQWRTLSEEEIAELHNA